MGTYPTKKVSKMNEAGAQMKAQEFSGQPGQKLQRDLDEQWKVRRKIRPGGNRPPSFRFNVVRPR